VSSARPSRLIRMQPLARGSRAGPARQGLPRARRVMPADAKGAPLCSRPCDRRARVTPRAMAIVPRDRRWTTPFEATQSRTSAPAFVAKRKPASTKSREESDRQLSAGASRRTGA
jgi:hypothetical protein